MSYGVSLVRNLEKIDRVITASYCVIFYTGAREKKFHYFFHCRVYYETSKIYPAQHVVPVWWLLNPATCNPDWYLMEHSRICNRSHTDTLSFRNIKKKQLQTLHNPWVIPVNQVQSLILQYNIGVILTSIQGQLILQCGDDQYIQEILHKLLQTHFKIFKFIINSLFYSV